MTLQPHEGTSETTQTPPTAVTAHQLQPHEGTSETSEDAPPAASRLATSTPRGYV